MILLDIQLPRIDSAPQLLLLLLTAEDYSTRAETGKSFPNRNLDVPNRMTDNTCIVIQTSRPAPSVPSTATGALAPQSLKQYNCILLLAPASNVKPTLQTHLTVSQASSSNDRAHSCRHKTTQLLLPNTGVPPKPKPSLLSFPHPSASPLQPVSAFHNTATRPRCYPFLKAVVPHRFGTSNTCGSEIFTRQFTDYETSSGSSYSSIKFLHERVHWSLREQHCVTGALKLNFSQRRPRKRLPLISSTQIHLFEPLCTASYRSYSAPSLSWLQSQSILYRQHTDHGAFCRTLRQNDQRQIGV
jgi:hypothetical protein